jgi:hypothetical protein
MAVMEVGIKVAIMEARDVDSESFETCRTGEREDFIILEGRIHDCTKKFVVKTQSRSTCKRCYERRDASQHSRRRQVVT